MKNNLSGSYYLAKDIDCSATSSWNSGAGFVPIGTSSSPFKGTFDGKGHKIIKLYISRAGIEDVGLFGYSSTGTIKNIILENANITGGNRTGALVGRINGNLTVENAGVTGKIYGRGNYCCIGGLAGCAYGSFVINNSYSKAKVDTNVSWSGGLVGDHYTGVIKNSYATGNVVGCPSICGGITGQVWNGGSIINSYSSGAINSCSSNCGGLTGRTSGGSFIKNYWNKQTSNITSSAGGATGITTEEMQIQSNFEDWDFENTWCLPAGDYPRLKFEDICISCTGCAVLENGVCVAGGSCDSEHPNCIVSNNHGVCECSENSCNIGRQCSGSVCVNCDASEGCGACGCGTSQKPTGAGSCLITNTCCAGECNVATGTDSCSYSDDACPSSACNRSTLSCCSTSLPYWRSSACKACSSTSGLSGACTTQGMECNGNYNCVPCNANDQCTCDAGEVANGSGSCVTPACSDDSECGVDQCINAGQYNAFCTNCSAYSQFWHSSSCASCPADAVYASGVCLCNDGKIWNRSTNSCFERGVTTSSGDLINLKRNNSNSATGRYDRIKNRMNRIKTKVRGAIGDKSIEEE